MASVVSITDSITTLGMSDEVPECISGLAALFQNDKYEKDYGIVSILRSIKIGHLLQITPFLVSTYIGLTLSQVTPKLPNPLAAGISVEQPFGQSISSATVQPRTSVFGAEMLVEFSTKSFERISKISGWSVVDEDDGPDEITLELQNP